ADLELRAVRVGFDEPAACAALHRQAAGLADGEGEEHVRAPPRADLVGELVESTFRARANANGHQHARSHHSPSTCDLNAASCSAQSCSVCSSQRFSAAIGAAFNE